MKVPNHVQIQVVYVQDEELGYRPMGEGRLAESETSVDTGGDECHSQITLDIRGKGVPSAVDSGPR